MEHCRDLTVVQSLCNGDSYAGTLLLNEVYGKVKRYLFFRLQSKNIDATNEELEDIVQEAIYRAWENIDEYDGRASFATWVCGFGIKIIYEEMRKRARDNKLLAKFFERIDDREPKDSLFKNPADRLVAIETTEELALALESLPEDYQEIIFLHTFVGYTYKDISLDLKCTEASVRNKHYRSMKELEKLLRTKK